MLGPRFACLERFSRGLEEMKFSCTTLRERLVQPEVISRSELLGTYVSGELGMENASVTAVNRQFA